MHVKLPESAQTELFETQKSLIRIISWIAALVIFIAGTAMHIFYSQSGMNWVLRLGFVGLFVVIATISRRKSVSVNSVELLLAFAGSLLLARVLSQYYLSDLYPIHLVNSALIITTLSAVFIQKKSLIALLLPVGVFGIYSALYPSQNPQFPLLVGNVFLAASAIVGYFLAWQKMHLIQKSLSHENHKNTILNNLHDGILLQDTTGRSLSVNQSACQIFNLSGEQILTHKGPDLLSTLYHDDGASPYTYSELPSTLAKELGRVVKNYPMVAKKASGEMTHLEVSAIPIFENTSSSVVELVLITFRNVTELKKAQSMIESQRLQVLANAKLTSLGEMAAGIAHEINNPLTIILGRAAQIQKMIETGKATTKDIMMNLDRISDTTLRISKIVKSMKSLSRDTQNDEFQKTNLLSIIEDVINVSTDHLKKHEIKLHLEVDPLLELDCNPGLISQVFVNLVSNATDAIKEQPIERWIRIQSFQDNDYAKILFSDSGPGIPPNLKDKILLPFFTTKEAGKGTGIGLSLCRTIVENHNGRFYVDDSQPNTCFSIDLPKIQIQKKVPLIKVA